VISCYGLESLFSYDGPGTYHHAIRPTSYDFHYDAVIPAGTEQWRADYRAPCRTSARCLLRRRYGSTEPARTVAGFDVSPPPQLFALYPDW
jgi:hypothetical protein